MKGDRVQNSGAQDSGRRVPSLIHDGLKIYYGGRRFLLAAHSYRLDRNDQPYRRFSVTLLLASKNPFILETGVDDRVQAHVALIAPGVLRRRTLAEGSNLLIFDMPLGYRSYAALVSSFAGKDILVLDREDFVHLDPLFQKAISGDLSCAELDELFLAASTVARGSEPLPPEFDPRIRQVLELTETLSLKDMRTADLSRRVHLSPSRLRHLFREQTGCSLSDYVRWIATSRASEMWEQGRSMTDIAMEMGFYDLAHLNRAYGEVYGMHPSALMESDQVALKRCARAD